MKIRQVFLFSAACAAILAVSAVAEAQSVTVTGTVFADNDGDKVFSAGDEPLAGVVVGFESGTFATTDANGHYSLSASGSGVVWTRTPDGFSPAPTWQLIDGTADITVDMPLQPSTNSGPVTFVAAADSHLGVSNGAQVQFALQEAGSLVPAPHFLTIVGDLTNQDDAQEFMDHATARSVLDVPFVPVPGNHDWYDGGPLYRQYLGPTQYSFDDGGAHFIVLNFNTSIDDQAAFIQADLAFPHAPVVAAFLHGPPLEAAAAQLADAGVQFLFTGHTHGNHVGRHGSMIEWNTEALVFGGLDFTPAGYRVVQLVDDAFRTMHHVTVDKPVMTLTFPRQGSCVDAGDVLMSATAELGPSATVITVSIDGAAPVTLPPTGGWAYSGMVTLVAGEHDLVLTGQSGMTTMTEKDKVCVRAPVTLPAPSGDWQQLGNSGSHGGATTVTIAPPLRNLWTQPVGGYLFGGSPVIANGTVYVSVVDLADGDMGGVLAYDLVTGNELWEARGNAVRNAPAYADGKVVYVSSEGTVHAVDATTGESSWTIELGANQDELLSWIYAAPAIDQGLVLVGGQRTIIAADLATGTIVWSHMPDDPIWAVTLSTMAIGGGVGLGVISRGMDGVMAWDANDGTMLWTLGPPTSSAMMAAPVIDGDTVYLTNIDSSIYSVELTTGTVNWTTTLYNATGDFRYGIVGTPAISDGKLFIPTPKGEFVALDATSGKTLWTLPAGGTIIRALPYGTGGEKSFLASPVVTGDVIWIGGMDGLLRAVDTKSGGVIWEADLGAPIMSGIVPSPPYLVVGTFDGLLHTFLVDDGTHIDPNVQPIPLGKSGCAIAAGAAHSSPATGSTALAFLALVLAAGARRRRTNRRSR